MSFFTIYPKFTKATAPLLLSIAALTTSIGTFVSSQKDSQIKELQVEIVQLNNRVSQLTQENLDCTRRINLLIKHANIPGEVLKDSTIALARR